MKEYEAEEHAVRLLEQHTRVPAVRQMRGGTKPKRWRPVAACRRLEPRGGRFEKSLILTMAPTSLHTGVACGAMASHSFKAPHSSTSKWLQLIRIAERRWIR